MYNSAFQTMPSCVHIALDYNMNSTELQEYHFKHNLQLILNVPVICITQNSCFKECTVIYWVWQTLFQLFNKEASLSSEKITVDLASQRHRKKSLSLFTIILQNNKCIFSVFIK